MENYFDEQGFVEQYHPDYNCQAIADIDDISVVLDNDFDDDRKESLERGGYFEMSEEELREELDRLQAKVLREAFENYMKIMYPNVLK